MADAPPSEYPQTPIQRWNANIEALQVLKQLGSEGRRATPEEAEVLARYSGFGDSAFEKAFVPHTTDHAWRERAAELRGLVTRAEFASIAASRPNAFYTSPEVVEEMWAGLDAMGELRERPVLRVLEPAAGSGRFLTHQPPHLSAKSEHTAVELDTLSAGVLSHVLSEYPRRASYPDAFVWNTGFEAAPVPDNYYDIAISNVPFGNYRVHDPEYQDSGRKHLTSNLHNYFFAKALDKLRPGGIMAFVTTHYTMDAPGAKRVREHLAERADLVGAVRLPDNAFPDTQVVTDII